MFCIVSFPTNFSCVDEARVDQDIAYRFGVGQSDFSKKNLRNGLINNVCNLQPLIVWPRLEEMFKKEFSRCICIIDCFEVFCERPSDLILHWDNWDVLF